MKNKNLQTIRQIEYEKGFAMPLVIAIIVLVVLIGGGAYFVLTQQPSTSEDAMMKKESEIMEKETMEKEGGAMMKDESMMKYSGAVLAGRSSPILDFNKTEYDEALKSDKLIVLYFYANWCPICKVEVANALYPAFNELSTDKVIGFRVNYNDNQTDNEEKNLAKEFGVAYQHTKVFLKNGKRVLKSPESWGKDRYFSEINKIVGQ